MFTTKVYVFIIFPLSRLFFGKGRSNAVTARGEHEEEAAANNADDKRQTGEELLGVFGRNGEQATDDVLIKHGDCKEDEH